MKAYDVAVVGATGLVGRTMMRVLEERKFPVNRLLPLASERSAGKQVTFNGRTIEVETLTPEKFKGIHFALFSAGASVSKEFAPHAVKAGTVVIDNSSAFRMDEDVPLVVPEVNRHQAFKHKGIIANPNCSTIQMVVVLKPLHDRYTIKRVVVSTYQSVTGAGQRAVAQLEDEVAQRPLRDKKFPHPIAYNCLPHIDVFFDDGYTKEEVKMKLETKKIMEADIPVTATTVRVPVMGGHSESVNIEFAKPCTVDEVREVLNHAPGVVLQDDPAHNVYPMPLTAFDKDDVFVGRIRLDDTVPHGINLWIVSDNIRKGAATNAVQIAEALIAGT
ncbi:MAG: aspartate-semialdehyde dehydrogenase [Ignavibacteriales bacterium]|nr:aspartate-semialdehyde dehydrogenase [Ignavibacteriales bacterium]